MMKLQVCREINYNKLNAATLRLDIYTALKADELL